MDTLEKEISEIDVRELIMEVRKYAPIWNTDSNENYHLDLKTDQWAKIAYKVFKLDYENIYLKKKDKIKKKIKEDKDKYVEIVKRKWKLIRCNYRKKLTRIPLKNIDKYPNARLLEFLLPMMKFDASVEKSLRDYRNEVKNRQESTAIAMNRNTSENIVSIESDLFDTTYAGLELTIDSIDSNNNNMHAKEHYSENQLPTVASNISAQPLENGSPQMVLNTLPRITLSNVDTFQALQKKCSKIMIPQNNVPPKKTDRKIIFMAQPKPPVTSNYTQFNTQPNSFNIQMNIQPIIKSTTNLSSTNNCSVETHLSINTAKFNSSSEFTPLLDDNDHQSQIFNINSPSVPDPYDLGLHNVEPNLELLNQTTYNQILNNETLHKETSYALTSLSVPDPQITFSYTNGIIPEHLEFTQIYNSGIPSPVKSKLFSTDNNEPVILTFDDLIQDD